MKKLRAGKRQHFTLRLKPELAELLRVGARAAGIPISQVVEECVEAKGEEIIENHLRRSEAARAAYAKLKGHKTA